MENIIDDSKTKTGGVNFRYLELNNEKIKWQVLPIEISGANTRFDIPSDAQTIQSNDKVIGVVITTDDIFNADGTIKNDAEKCINDSTISLSIDNEELFPDGFSCELVSQKIGKTMFECMHPCYEKAAGSKISGYIKSSANLYTRPFKARIHLCCSQSKKK